MENHRLGRAALDLIDAEGRLCMRVFGDGSWEPGKEPACGTVACLAGHVLVAAGYAMRDGNFYRPGTRSLVGDPGCEALDLLGGRLETGSCFFDYERGPDRFRKLVEAAEGRAA